MKKVDISTARANLTGLIEGLQDGPVELTRYGRVVAVLNLPGPDRSITKPEKSKGGSFEVSEPAKPPEFHVVESSAKARQAARDALLNAMNDRKKK